MEPLFVMNDVEAAEAMVYVNEHRAAVGREPIVTYTKDEVREHLRRISESAPFGNDPWADEPTCPPTARTGTIPPPPPAK